MEGDVTVREIMTREYVGVSESDTVQGAVDLMLEEGARAVVVLHGSDPVGMLTSDEALTHLTHDGSAEAAVSEVMAGTTPSVSPDSSFVDAAIRMADAHVDCLLVTENTEGLVGTITDRDIVRATASIASRPGSPVHPNGMPVEPETDTEAADGGFGVETEGEERQYSSQSVCESCGSFSPELHNFNGQLICSDCREV